MIITKFDETVVAFGQCIKQDVKSKNNVAIEAPLMNEIS
jgi:hypothetical protein